MSFESAVEIILRPDVEGGFSDNPSDPGGATNFGITTAVARAHGYTGDMRDLSRDLAMDIYRSDYWQPIEGDQLPWPLALFVFDSAVNQGVRAAIQMLQRALDTTQDGVIGATTLRLATQSRAWHCSRFMAFRALRYGSTHNVDKFGETWYTRLFIISMCGYSP